MIWLDGLYLGSLDAYERERVDQAVAQGIARLTYEGVGGFLGLARVRLNESPADVSRSDIATLNGQPSPGTTKNNIQEGR